MRSKPCVPVQCASNVSSVAAADLSPGSNRTGSQVPVPCSPSGDVVDVAAAVTDGERIDYDDDDVASRVDRVSLQSRSRSLSQTVPARLYQQSDVGSHHSRQRAPLRNVFSCDSGNFNPPIPDVAFYIPDVAYRFYRCFKYSNTHSV